MTTPTYPLITRPGGYSAKNTRQAGAPNTQPSGENPMVGNTPAPGSDPATGPDPALVDEIHDRLAAEIHQFLYTASDGQLVYSSLALAVLVAEMVTEYTAQHRAEGDLLASTAWGLAGEVSDLRAERDAVLRQCEVREQDVIALTGDRDQALARVAELESALRRAGHGEVTR